jgi:hypothetical protein
LVGLGVSIDTPLNQPINAKITTVLFL